MPGRGNYSAYLAQKETSEYKFFENLLPYGKRINEIQKLSASNETNDLEQESDWLVSQIELMGFRNTNMVINPTSLIDLAEQYLIDIGLNQDVESFLRQYRRWRKKICNGQLIYFVARYISHFVP